MRHWKKIAEECCIYGCEAPRFIFGRCKMHVAALDSASYQRLRKMSKTERRAEFQKKTQPEKHRWEWCGDEDNLAEMTAKLEVHKQ